MPADAARDADAQPAAPPADPPAGPDFDRGLCVCTRPGPEFATRAGRGHVGMWFAQQMPMAALGVVVLGLIALRQLVGLPDVVLVPAVVVAFVVLQAVILGGGRFRRPDTTGAAFARDSDARHRVRVAIPPRGRSRALTRWLDAALVPPPSTDAAAMAPVPGGFEPLIARAWFAQPFDRARWLTALGAAAVVAGGVWLTLLLTVGGVGSVLRTPVAGITAVGLVGLVIAAGLLTAEAAFPVYLRVVPGRLDLFRFGLLGLGGPTVRSIDLRRHGVSVDIASFGVVIEPPRPPGTPLPALVTGKTWPYSRRLPADFRPEFLSLALTPGRLELATRIVQAARTSEPPPDLPMDRLVG
jgi:hypothetical protein